MVGSGGQIPVPEGEPFVVIHLVFVILRMVDTSRLRGTQGGPIFRGRRTKDGGTSWFLYSSVYQSSCSPR